MFRPPFLSIALKLVAAASWAGVCALSGTYLMGQANLCASLLLGPPRSNVVEQARNAATISAATLAVFLAALLVFAFLVPALRATCRRVSYLYALTFVTGLPVAMMLLALTSATGKDLRGAASLFGLVAFFLWIRTLAEAWRGATLVLRAAR